MKLNKEIKRQLILIGILLCMLIATLVLWYDNFLFHSYVNVVDYQYCYGVQTDDFIIDGYQIYKDGQVQKYGGARFMTLKNDFILKNDTIELALVITKGDKEEKFVQKYKVKTDNEVCVFEKEDMKQQLFEEDFSNVSFHMSIQRKKKVIYDEDLDMKSQDLLIYNGSNKDYSIQNVYVGKKWLKTGDFSSTIKGIEKQYPYMSVDYLCLKDQGNAEDINDYERFVHMQGETVDFLENNHEQSAFYDGLTSLMDKKIICVISLKEDESQDNMFTFMIEISGTMKG